MSASDQNCQNILSTILKYVNRDSEENSRGTNDEGVTETSSASTDPVLGTLRKFECINCYAVFHSRSSLNSHQWIHVEENPCKLFNEDNDACKKEPEQEGIASDEHGLVFCNLNNDFVCNVCQKRFSLELELRRHYVHGHSAKQDLICNVCTKLYPTKSAFWSHVQRVHDPETDVYCADCGKRFKAKSELKKHIHRYHLQAGNHGCAICKKRYHTAYDLKRHVDSHGRYGQREKNLLSCNLCQEKFQGLVRLKIHALKTHCERKRYICVLCDQLFQQRQMFDNHFRTHVEKKKMVCKCDICDRGFVHKSLLMRHTENVHSKVKPSFGCDVCGREYRRKDNLRDHIRIYHDLLACAICRVSFNSKEGLQNHYKNKHRQEKLHHCATCKIHFGSKYILKNHLADHRREVPLIY